MGQLVGKARLKQAAEPFVNLDSRSVYRIWEGFNDIAEGFGINVEEACEICIGIQGTTFAHAPKQVLISAVEKLFKALDTDQNGLVDALEMIVTLCVLSGMELREKAKFCFMCYDFDESSKISIDELTLLLKSCTAGMCKLGVGIAPPDEFELEKYSQDAFRRSGGAEDARLQSTAFLEYCASTPEIVSWVNAFDDLKDFSAEDQFSIGNQDENRRRNKLTKDTFASSKTLDEVLGKEGIPMVHSYVETKARDPDCKGNKGRRGRVKAEAKPWLETALATVPTGPPKPDLSHPDGNTLDLEWVHGYSAQDTRNNLQYTQEDEIVYTAAGVAVVYNPESHTQRFNLDHTDKILALATHPSESIVATGEVGSPPKVHVWDSRSCGLVGTLRGVHEVGVGSLAFSREPEGRWLLSVGQDAMHTVAVYNWREAQLVFSMQSTLSRVLDAAFKCTVGPGEGKSTVPSFVTCGEEHIFFWNLDGNQRRKKGIYGKTGKPQTMLSVASSPKSGRFVSGSMSGHLYYWDSSRSLQRTIKAHDSAVTSLKAFARGFVSGGDDGKVRTWSHELEQGAIFDAAGLGSMSPGISSVTSSHDGSKLLIGTRGSEVFEISAQDGSNVHPGPVVSGHFTGELHGLCVHPHKLEYCTVGDDQSVRIWDMETKRLLRMVKLDCRARACEYSPDGSLIVVGLGK